MSDIVHFLNKSSFTSFIFLKQKNKKNCELQIFLESFKVEM